MDRRSRDGRKSAITDQTAPQQNSLVIRSVCRLLGRDQPEFHGRSRAPPCSASRSSGGGGGGGGGSRRTAKPRWSGSGSAVWYTPEEVRALEPIRETVEKREPLPDRRDVFLCHAWDDRQGVAKEGCTICLSHGASRYGSAKKTLASARRCSAKSTRDWRNRRVGIVLVTSAFLRRVQGEGIAEKRISALLARNLLVPIVHDTTYEALRDVSPLLGSRTGLSTEENPMADVAAKLAELVAVPGSGLKQRRVNPGRALIPFAGGFRNVCSICCKV